MVRVATGGEEHITACGTGVVINEPGNPNDNSVLKVIQIHMLCLNGWFC